MGSRLRGNDAGRLSGTLLRQSRNSSSAIPRLFFGNPGTFLRQSSGAQHALGVEARKGAGGVVARLEVAVRVAPVEAMELLLRKEAVRIERLDAAELGDLALDEAVEWPRGVGRARALHVPEAEVDVQVVAHGVEGEGSAPLRIEADGADPLRPERDVRGVEVEELRRARDRDVDVLDDRLGVQAEQALNLLRHAGPAVPAHDFRIGARAEPRLAADEPPDERVLREDVLGAPEPVGVPAPQVILDGEVVLALLADGPVVDVLERVVARIGCGFREMTQGDVHLPGPEHRAVDEVDGARVQLALERLEIRAGIAESEMREAYIGLHRDGLRLDAQRIAERAVGVRKAVEKVGVAVV